MIKIKHSCLGLFILLVFSTPVFSQKKTRKEIKGDKYYSYYSFDKAIEKYKKVEDLTVEGQRNLAESYKKTGKTVESEAAYAGFVQTAGATAEDYYNFAGVLIMNGKYDEANKWMNKFKGLKPTDLRVKNYTYDKLAIDKLLKDENRFKIVNLDMNSSQDDFGPAYYDDKIIFTSSREVVGSVKRIYNWNRKPFLNIYVASVTDGQLTNVKALTNKVNHKLHEGPASYSSLDKTLAYTQNNYDGKSKEGVINLQLFFKSIKNNEWQKSIPFKLNNKEYSVGHPWLSHDGKTMYFASDMPGGFGGVDLYLIKRDDAGNWGNPVNLGDKVNTEGNEMFPFFEEISGKLFFASNGHQGLGGLDIFITSIKSDSAFGKVLNAGTPMNTQYDDFAIIINDEMKKGYFSSNRAGGKGGDDIYSFELLKPFTFQKVVKGVVKDNKGEILPNTLVSLLDDKNVEKAKKTVGEDGKFSFDVDDNKKYSLEGNKEEYFEGKNSFTSEGSEDIIYSNLILEKIPELSLRILTTDRATRFTLPDVKVKLINNLTDKTENFVSSASGDVIKPLSDNKINDRISYNMVIEKEGYLSKTVTYNRTIDKDGQYDVNIGLDKIDVGTDIASLIEIKPIYFDLGKSTIRKDAALELDKIVKVMNENPKMVIELGSHTDCRGSFASNESLSNQRAISSADYIKKKITNPERIYGKGYGESRLKNACSCEGSIKSTCTEAEHQQNRRTEFIIIKTQ
jgi:outer membrane protein OmpA-like peptidoglycan-associated protein/tetratricopeptide (TPR) repeat protein